MKNAFLILAALFIACTSTDSEIRQSDCLNKVDSIAAEQSFREAIDICTECVETYSSNSKLKLRLAEFHLLSYLVDGEEDGLTNSKKIFSDALNIDSSFHSNHSDFNLNAKQLNNLRVIWFDIQSDEYQQERVRILTWALIDKFEKEKEPKLIK